MAGLSLKGVLLASLVLLASTGCESSLQARIAALQRQNNMLKGDLAGAHRRLAEVERELQQSQAESTQNDIETPSLSWANANPYPPKSIDLFRFPPAYDFGGMTDPAKVGAPANLEIWEAPIDVTPESLSLPSKWYPIGVIDLYPNRQDLIDDRPNRRP
jgi:hypothetical protein